MTKDISCGEYSPVNYAIFKNCINPKTAGEQSGGGPASAALHAFFKETDIAPAEIQNMVFPLDPGADLRRIARGKLA